MSDITCVTPANDIVAIASAGVMGLAAAIIVGALFWKNAPKTNVLVACIVVLVIGSITQLTDKFMQRPTSTPHSVTVSIKPTPTEFVRYFPNIVQTQLKNKPYIWLSAGPAHCFPTDPDYSAKDCPGFDKLFPLSSSSDTIEVSVEAIMGELYDRMAPLQIASDSNASRLAAAQLGKADAEPQFTSDLNVKGHQP